MGGSFPKWEGTIFGLQDRAKLLNLFEETNDFK
jgi:hypothetical protein